MVPLVGGIALRRLGAHKLAVDTLLKTLLQMKSAQPWASLRRLILMLRSGCWVPFRDLGHPHVYGWQSCVSFWEPWTKTLRSRPFAILAAPLSFVAPLMRMLMIQNCLLL